MDQENSEASRLNAETVLQVLQAVPGLTERLAQGIHVVDVGCGAGCSTVIMASAFPSSRFLGLEANEAIVERARDKTRARSLRNVYWVAADAQQLAPLPTHDLICAFRGLHDLPDPVVALRAIRAALAEDGVYLWCERAGAQGRVWTHAPAEGFSCIERLPVEDAVRRCFALRK